METLKKGLDAIQRVLDKYGMKKPEHNGEEHVLKLN